MVEGVVNDRPNELEYLSKMMKMHYDWFLYYQKAHDALVDKDNSPKLKPSTSTSNNRSSS